MERGPSTAPADAVVAAVGSWLRGMAGPVTRAERAADGTIEFEAGRVFARLRRSRLPVTQGAILALLRAAPDQAERRALFSVSGFTPGAVAVADTQDIALFDLAPDGRLDPVNPPAHALVPDAITPTTTEAAVTRALVVQDESWRECAACGAVHHPKATFCAACGRRLTLAPQPPRPSSFPWDVERYGAFADERRRPAMELLRRVDLADPSLVVDLGCGSGEITRTLAQRWPQAHVIGLDASAEMLDAARISDEAIEWRHGRIEDWQPEEPADLLFANASLHWLPDHHRLVPRLLDALAPAGTLAVQMPLSWHEPSHVLMRRVLASGGPDGGALGPTELRARLGTPPVAPPEAYLELLGARTSRLDLWTTTDYLRLEGDDPVFLWVSGAGLRPILTSLEEPDRAAFVAAYRAALRTEYAPVDGVTTYRLPRLYFVAST